jgi:nitric oxide reductase activation protein
LTSVNRFIQFNNETIDAKEMIRLEQLARALSQKPSLSLTIRKLMEFQPKVESMSISHFWQHREVTIQHNGQLSDLYLLTLGFWRQFDLGEWGIYKEQVEHLKLKEFAFQLLFSAEEFRLTNLISRQRPGTQATFAIREEVYVAYHEQQLQVNLNKGFLSDALFSFLYISIRKTTNIDQDIYPSYFKRILEKWQYVYDSNSTQDNTKICLDILYLIEDIISKDLIHTFMSIHENLMDILYAEKAKSQVNQVESIEESSPDSIEEMFHSWHRENEKRKGTHLEFDLTDGNTGKINNGRLEEGNEANNIQSEAGGSSVSNKNEKQQAKGVSNKTSNSVKQTGERFGDEHVNVTFEEKRMTPNTSLYLRKQIDEIRMEQKPYVKSFIKEIRKRIEQKQTDKRTNLSMGRLTSKLTSLVIDDRPKPFYKKQKPAIPLDAVFGLLIDSSASMMDKMEETKKAVLLFHDVLRNLSIRHDIVSYNEDAYGATEKEQPNSFVFCHQVEDGTTDNADAIFALEAQEDNRDGLAIRWMAERLQRRSEKHKFILLFSDGEPSAFGYAANGIIDTAEAVIEVEKKGIHILHLFLSAEEPLEEQIQVFKMMYGGKTAIAKNVDEFTTQTLRLLRRMLYLIVK